MVWPNSVVGLVVVYKNVASVSSISAPASLSVAIVNGVVEEVSCNGALELSLLSDNSPEAIISPLTFYAQQ